MDYVPFIVAFLLILIVCVGGWIWLIVGVTKLGWRRRFGAMAFQMSIVAFAEGLLHGDLFSALTSGLFPPILVVLFDQYAKFGTFIGLLIPVSATVGAVVLAIFLSVPRLRLWCVAPTLLAAMIAGIWMGENVSQNAMCDTAADLGIKNFQRKSFAWSLANTPQEFQFDIHAVAGLNGQRLGWSYREMGWYVIPTDAWGEVDAPVFDCSPWIWY